MAGVYCWTTTAGVKTPSDIGTVHLLHRDLPSNQKYDNDEDEDDDDDIEADHRTATRSRSTRSIASGFVRAMHTAIIVLGREAHPRTEELSDLVYGGDKHIQFDDQITVSHLSVSVL